MAVAEQAWCKCSDNQVGDQHEGLQVSIEKKRAMRSAIQEGDVGKVRALISTEKELIHTMTAFGTWLHVAATVGNVEIMELLFQAGIKVNARGGTFDGGALNLAASAGHVNAIEWLLDHGAEMDVSDSVRNPLFAAVYGGHVDVAKLLLDRGIDQKVAYSGSTVINMDARAFADERGQREMITLLDNYCGNAPD